MPPPCATFIARTLHLAGGVEGAAVGGGRLPAAATATPPADGADMHGPAEPDDRPARASRFDDEEGSAAARDEGRGNEP